MTLRLLLRRINRAEIGKAKEVAQSLIALAGLDEQRYSQYAQDLLQSGRKQEAISFLEKSFDFPPGQHLEIGVCGGLVHAFANGADLGTFHAPQVLKVALGRANGADYLRTLTELISMANNLP